MLVTRVVAGDAATPALIACVAIAPLIALLGATTPVDRLPRARGAGDAALVVALLLVLAANLVVVAEFLRGLGLAHAPAVTLGPTIALTVVVCGFADRLWRFAIPVGVALLLVPLAVVGSTYGAPWATWAAAASRPALMFGQQSAWVATARPLGDRATLTFEEVHRVVAGTDTTLHVVERHGGHRAMREWRVTAGDTVTLRPGDELTLEAGTPVRFEAGRRIPGAPASGAAWADGRVRPSPIVVIGLAITLVAGALVLVPAAARPLAGVPAMTAAGLMLAFVLGAALWGVYAIAVVPEVMLPPRGVLALPELAPLLGGPSPVGSLPVIVGAGLVSLLVGTVLAWRARLVDVAAALAVALGRPTPSRAATTAFAAAVTIVAGALATSAGDPWPLFTIGLGVAGACAAAPRLARTGAVGEAAGTIVGAVAFAVALVLGSELGPPFGVVQEYPALAAAPLAWLVARVARE